MARRRVAAEHYSQAQDTEALYREIGGSDSAWPGWAATLLFYTAVKEVDAAIMDICGVMIADHHQRGSEIRTHLPNIEATYRMLKDLARDCRYDGQKPTKSRLLLAEMALKNIREEIKRIAPPPY